MQKLIELDKIDDAERSCFLTTNTMETGKNVKNNYNKKFFMSMLIVLFITVLFCTFASHIL